MQILIPWLLTHALRIIDVQKHALQIGYSQELWDDDWEITDLPIEHKYWKDLTADEQEGATFFGYTQSTWDEVEDGDFQDDGKSSSSSSKVCVLMIYTNASLTHSTAQPTKHHSKPSKVHHSKPHNNNNKPSEEKKDDVDDDETKHKIKTSRAYGGDGGGPFTTKAGTIVKMIVHGNAVVEGLSVEFRNGQKQHFGSDDGGKDHEFALERGECIIKVEVRHERLVQSLTFYTNRDHKFGPFGGRGRMLKDKAGEVSEVRAPPGYRLVGLTGRVGKMVDAVAFRWGAINHWIVRETKSR